MKNHRHQCYVDGNDPQWRLSQFANDVNEAHRWHGCRHSNATLSSSLEKKTGLRSASFFLSLFRIVVLTPCDSFLQRCVALKIMTRHGDTRLTALRPFLKLIRPESRYVYVCGNVPTSVAIYNILLRFFFITSRPCTPAFSLSLILSLGRDEIESRLRGAKRHGVGTKSRSEGGWERSGGERRLRGVAARLKISNDTLHALFSTFLRSASKEATRRLTDDAIDFRINEDD